MAMLNNQRVNPLISWISQSSPRIPLPRWLTPTAPLARPLYAPSWLRVVVTGISCCLLARLHTPPRPVSPMGRWRKARGRRWRCWFHHDLLSRRIFFWFPRFMGNSPEYGGSRGDSCWMLLNFLMVLLSKSKERLQRRWRTQDET